MSKRSAGIDALRGALSLWVMFAHAIPWAVASQGNQSSSTFSQWLSNITTTIFQPHGETNPAVLTFIVLSGYCIQKSWSKNQDIRKFCIRRVFRIGPVFVLGLCAGILGFLVMKSISPTPDQLTGTKSIELTCLVAKATALAALTPAFHPCSYLGNAPLLTVMVEIALYAAFPLLLWRGRRAVIAACACCVIAGLVISIRGNFLLYNWWQNSSLYGFLPYWWIGAAFAMKTRLREIDLKSLLVAWVLLTALALYDTTAFASELRKIPFALLAGMLIIKIDEAHLRTGLISSIGRGGYSLYALHAPILYSLLTVGVPWWLACSVIVLVGVIAFRVVELPLDRFGHNLAETRHKNVIEAKQWH